MQLIAAMLSAAMLFGGLPGRRGNPSPSPGAEGQYCDPATGCSGGSVFHGNTDRGLYLVDIGAGSPRVTPVGTLGVEITDLARAPSGQLYAVSFDRLSVVDQASGRARSVGPLGLRNVNGLAWHASGLLASSTDGFLHRINVQTGRATAVGAFGQGITSSGDICSGPGGEICMTSPHGPRQSPIDRLVRVDPRTGAAALVGSTGLGRIYGLAWASSALIALTESGAVARLDIQTGAATLIGQGGVPFWGAS